MSATYDRTDDYVSVISDAGREKLAAEIRIWTAAAGVVAIAGLVLNQILGG